MTVLYYADERSLGHVAGEGHPESPDRLRAVARGIADAGLADALEARTPAPASLDALARVHDPAYVAAVERFCQTGGGQLDGDTGVVPASYGAALGAAGAGIDAVRALQRGEGTAAFCAVRPPGHHARPNRAMGFCLFNNVAVAAAALAEAGERVLIVDYDVHHGNGTQEMFWSDARVAYVSLHERPLYPGTGSVDEMGADEAFGTNLNLPVPAGATGELYRMAFDAVVVPFAERFAPDWLLLSAGFDAHRDDPLAGVSLSSGDFGDLTARLMGLVPAGRLVAFLEGGYHLRALADSAGATLSALAGRAHFPEPVTTGGPGRASIDALAQHFGC